MQPTLLSGDYILVNKFVYGPKLPRLLPLLNIELPDQRPFDIWDPEAGDIILFENESEDSLTINLRTFVKRCVAVPGDMIVMKKGTFFINGKKFFNIDEIEKTDSSYFKLPSQAFKGYDWLKNDGDSIVIPKAGDEITINPANLYKWRCLLRNDGMYKKIVVEDNKVFADGNYINIYKVKNDQFFVLGDNLEESFDSRYWGFVSKRKILGKAMMIYWSLEPIKQGPFVGDYFSNIRWNRIFNTIN